MYLKDKKLMPPPWLACPEIERYSIGWRMGYGEEYIYRFFSWLEELSSEERVEYQALFPEPAAWKGWWSIEAWRVLDTPVESQWDTQIYTALASEGEQWRDKA